MFIVQKKGVEYATYAVYATNVIYGKTWFLLHDRNDGWVWVEAEDYFPYQN